MFSPCSEKRKASFKELPVLLNFSRIVMDHQTLRVSQSQEDINSADQKDYLQQFYYTMPGQPLPNPAHLGVRLAPLAKFDEKDFDLPMVPYEAKHKVKLFKALLIFFSTVIMLVGLASSAFGVYYILDKERVQMHQVDNYVPQ